MAPRRVALAEWRRGVRGMALAAALLCLSGVGRAEPSPAEIAQARRLFSDATELREAGKWAEAATKLREAIAIKDTPGLRFHLAHCEEQMGHLVEAEADYDRAAALIREGAKAADVAELLEAARAALRERVPTVIIRAPPGVRELRLTIDDQPVSPATLGARVPLNPGTHAIEVDASARRPFRLEVVLKEGEDRVVEADLKSEPEAPKPAATAPPARPPRRHEMPVSTQDSGFGAREAVLVGEGVLTAAGLGLGIYFLVRADSDDQRATSDLSTINSYSMSDKVCSAPPAKVAAACADLPHALDDHVADRARGIAGLVVGGVGAASLALTWIIWPSKSTAHAASVQMIPSIRGAVIRGAF